MSFPSIAATNNGREIDQVTSHVVNLPIGVASGNLLIVIITFGGNPTATWPTGWTQLFAAANGTSPRVECRFRRADGTEGSTITITTDVAKLSAHGSYRITGHHTTVNPEAGTAATGTSANPDPPNLAPSWGLALDALWIAIYGWTNVNVLHSAYPTNYTLGQLNNLARGTGDTAAGIVMAARQLNAASENPGVGTLDTSGIWVANTLAVLRAVETSTLGIGGATGPAGALKRDASRFFGGSNSPAGALKRDARRAFGGSNSPAGALRRNTMRLFPGILLNMVTAFQPDVFQIDSFQAPPPSDGALKTFPLLVKSGVFDPVATLVRFVSRFFSGATGPAGALKRDARRAFGGSNSPAGALRRNTMRLFPGILLNLVTAFQPDVFQIDSFQAPPPSDGALKTFPLLVKSGVFDPVATLVRFVSRFFSGATSPTGAAYKQAPQATSGELSSAGAILNQPQRRVTGRLEPGPSTLIKRPLLILAAVLSPVAGLLKQKITTLTATITSAGAAARLRIVFLTLTGAASSSGTLAQQPQLPKSGAVSPGGALGKQARSILAGALSSAGSLIKGVRSLSSGFLTPSSSLTVVKKAALALSGAITSAGVVLRQAQLIKSGQLSALSGQLVKETRAVFAGALSFAGTLLKQPQRLYSAILSFVGSLARTPQPAHGGAISSSGVLQTIKASLLSLTGAISSSGALIKHTGLRKSGQLSAVSGQLLKEARAVFTGTITSTSTLLREARKISAGTLTSAGAIAKEGRKILASTLTSASAILKEPRRIFTGTLTSASVILKEPRRSFAGGVTSAGSLSKTPQRIFVGALTLAGLVNRAFSIVLGGVLGFLGNLIKEIFGLPNVTVSDAEANSCGVSLALANDVTLSNSVIATVDIEAKIIS